MSEQDELMKNNIELSELSARIDDLNDSVKKSQRFWSTFGLGIIKGFGAAIGATIVFAIAITIVAAIFGDVPVVQKLLDLSKVDSYIDTSE